MPDVPLASRPPVSFQRPRRLPPRTILLRMPAMHRPAVARTAPLLVALGLALLAAGCLPQNPLRSRKKSAPVAAVDASRIRADVAWLADDAREGRATGTPGNDAAARCAAA